MNVMRLLLNKYKRNINKVIKGGSILSILLALMISLIIPPFNIYADDYTSSTIVGFNVNLDEVNINAVSSGYSYLYNIEITLDNNYVGYLQVGATVNYYAPGSSSSTSFLITQSNRFVNGNKIVIPFKISGDGYLGSERPALGNVVLSYGNHNLTLMSSLQSMNEIINILNDLYSNTDGIEGLLNDQFDQLELIVSALGLSNQYLDDIRNLRMYNFPIESFLFNYSMYKYGYEIIDMFDVSYYKYPVFKLKTNNYIFNNFYLGANQEATCVFYSFRNLVPLSSNVDYNFHLISWSSLNYININGNLIYLYKVTFKADDSAIQSYLKYINNTDLQVIPIYLGASNRDIYLSTDFAINYGYKNEFLNNISIIAQGTTQSNQSSSDLENQNSSFDTTSNSLYTSENAFNNDMNNKLQSIDTSFNPSTSFGSKFLSSADWVRTQFNNLTSTSPFGTVLSFSMLLGLSLLIIGKVFK